MALSWWRKAYGKFSCIIGQYMQKKNIKIFSCWVRGVHSTTFDPKLRNERFTLIFFMGFQICIINTKNGKLTFSNGPQLMEKSLWQIVMNHCMVCAKEEFQNILILGQGGPFHIFDPKLRNERFTLIFFMRFQICIFNTKNSKLTFWNGPQLMGKKVYGKLPCIIGQYMQK